MLEHRRTKRSTEASPEQLEIANDVLLREIILSEPRKRTNSNAAYPGLSA